jgi:hypothetical protein
MAFTRDSMPGCWAVASAAPVEPVAAVDVVDVVDVEAVVPVGAVAAVAAVLVEVPDVWVKAWNTLANGSVDVEGTVVRNVGLTAPVVDAEALVLRTGVLTGVIRTGSRAMVVCAVILIRQPRWHFARHS